MDSEKKIWLEKFSEEFHPYLTSRNHTNFSMASTSKNLKELKDYLSHYNLNFLGIAKAPYNNYGRHFCYCAVFEDIDNDYEILWHHVSDCWINSFLEELGSDYRWRGEK